MRDLREAKCAECGDTWKYAKEMTDRLHRCFCSFDCAREYFDTPEADKAELEEMIVRHDFRDDKLENL